jgi:hypothetical protein
MTEGAAPGVATYSDAVEFFGHPMVRSAHRTTIEVTRDEHLTIDGDCIIGVKADKGLTDLSGSVKDALQSEGSKVTVLIEVPGDSFTLHASGNAALSLRSGHEMVIRRSDYICGRTLAVGADAAAKDIPRSLVESLRSPDCRGTLRIEVST